MGRSWPRSTRCLPSCGTRRSCCSSAAVPALGRLLALHSYPDLAEHLLLTLREILVAYGLAIAAGLGCGFALGFNRLVGRAYGPILAALYAVPAVVWYPSLMLFFGRGAGAGPAAGPSFVSRSGRAPPSDAARDPRRLRARHRRRPRLRLRPRLQPAGGPCLWADPGRALRGACRRVVPVAHAVLRPRCRRWAGCWPFIRIPIWPSTSF